MNKPLFAANWKMHMTPAEADAFFDALLAAWQPDASADVWFFPPALSVAAVAGRTAGLPGVAVGVQNVHWEARGAFTGEVSVPMAAASGARAVLVGHSERRHVFGESDAACARKVRAVLAGGLTPVLCVGERLEEREAGDTVNVVTRQLGALRNLPAADLAGVVIAYEPVWAIGTGRTATPADAAEVHGAIRRTVSELGGDGAGTRVLYGGSVKPDNASALMSEPEIDGVLVGGASLDPASWRAILGSAAD